MSNFESVLSNDNTVSGGDIYDTVPVDSVSSGDVIPYPYTDFHYPSIDSGSLTEIGDYSIWDADFSDLSSTDTLLVLILVVLILQLFFKRW